MSKTRNIVLLFLVGMSILALSPMGFLFPNSQRRHPHLHPQQPQQRRQRQRQRHDDGCSFLRFSRLFGKRNTLKIFGEISSSDKKHNPPKSSRARSQGTERGRRVRPPNEFSRKYEADLILAKRTGPFRIKIAATQDECKAVAQRFDLHRIAKLSAKLSLRPEGYAYPYSEDYCPEGIEVRGRIRANVTQTCTRTGELFSTAFEIPTFSVLRPVRDERAEAATAAAMAKTMGFSQSDNSRRRHHRHSMDQKIRKRKERQANKVRMPNRDLTKEDVMELQRKLDRTDPPEDVVIEDPSLYDEDGQVDIGELVAQNMWLHLDPFPRKNSDNNNDDDDNDNGGELRGLSNDPDSPHYIGDERVQKLGLEAVSFRDAENGQSTTFTFDGNNVTTVYADVKDIPDYLTVMEEEEEEDDDDDDDETTASSSKKKGNRGDRPPFPVEKKILKP